ncbi:IS66 family transposase [Methylobacterium terrae]|uniref:IS66 family transposase n=1 Tax=Methylobacterium terrae TaxID=2202827 RepID=A0A2U8WTV7_9HYPH|nr:IS66 family transposase [Methylobacterium terrae]AWN49734.1 IS66 family transposase [Methylobacterium terrae]
MSRSDLERLSKEELIELVLKLHRPEKTSRTSSKPPASDRKERREKARPGGAKPGHEGHKRALTPDPDQVMEHRPASCSACGEPLPTDLPAEVISVHERIDLPLVRPAVEQHRRLCVTCPACRTRVAAPRPAGADATPFGPRLHAVATYLKTFQALSYERLQAALSDLFGLRLSQGGLMNVLRRAQGCFAEGRDAALARLRQASVVASDETGVRIEGANSFHWVFRCEDAVVHHAAPSRASAVVGEVMAGHRPAVWLSDRYSAQQGHGERQQTCLAHLARDVAYAVEAGNDLLALRLQWWLDKAFGLARRLTELAASTLARKRRELEQDLDAILKAPATYDLAQAIRARMQRARDQLLTFVAFPGKVEVTNNACERDLRPAVIQRKVTNGYRAMWAAKGEADVRTVVATAALKTKATPFATLLATITA